MLKQLGNAVVGMGIVGVVDVIVSGEVGSDFFYHSLVALVFGQRALNEFAHTVAHIHRVGFEGMCRKSVFLQRKVGGSSKILDGIYQRAVEIENH